jgi:hypothetical protein
VDDDRHLEAPQQRAREPDHERLARHQAVSRDRDQRRAHRGRPAHHAAAHRVIQARELLARLADPPRAPPPPRRSPRRRARHRASRPTAAPSPRRRAPRA